MKIVTIVGARPQIIKAAALSRAINNKFNQLDEVIVHTGQHYDSNMSDVFFDEMGIPKPKLNLNVGSGNHGKQTAEMVEKLEEVFVQEEPDAIVVYGDTNSTLATAIAASKLHLPIVHIEAGLRSFNKKMPEEINRIMCDHASTLLFSPTATGINNLVNEGFVEDHSHPADMDHPRIYHCGDVMYDNSIYFSEISDDKSSIMQEISVEKDKYILATVHRNDNTDHKDKLTSIFNSFLKITNQFSTPIVLPLHPRTAKMMDVVLSPELKKEIDHCEFIKIIPPASFLDMIALEKNCKMILTDSGGVQKEAYFFNKPCVILRPQTEWVEIVDVGCAVLADADESAIIEATNRFMSKENLAFPPIFGDGSAAEFIADEIIKQL